MDEEATRKSSMLPFPDRQVWSVLAGVIMVALSCVGHPVSQTFWGEAFQSEYHTKGMDPFFVISSISPKMSSSRPPLW